MFYVAKQHFTAQLHESFYNRGKHLKGGIYMKIFKSIGKLLAIVVAAAVALVIVAYLLCLAPTALI